jgi:DNA-binding NarL/FixJ family response regulator
VPKEVSSILGKLNVSSRDAAVIHARLEGWILDGSPGDRFGK